MNEGVSLNGPIESVAFAIAVAEAYESAPVHDPSVDKIWDILKRHTLDVLFKRVKGLGIDIQYTKDDPYHEYGSNPKMMIRAMLYDIIANKRLIIYSDFSDNHPNFSETENVVFRTIHDYFTHGKLLSTFKKNYTELAKKHGIRHGELPTSDQLKAIIPNVSLSRGGNMGHALTHRGELNAASAHMRLAPDAAAPALFTEVVGQICYNMCTAQFPPQKVAILPGFDFKNLGQTIPGTDADFRKKELMQIIVNTPKDGFIDMKLSARPRVKLSILIKNVNSHDK